MIPIKPVQIVLPPWWTGGGQPTAALAPDSDALRCRLLEQQANGRAMWRTLDDHRACLRCRRTFAGRDVLIRQGLYSSPPEYDLLCPTPGCRSSPAEWTSQDEDVSIAARSVGDEERGFWPREVWILPHYRSAKVEDEMREVLWDQRRRADPLWARPNPHLVKRLVACCKEELCWVLYTSPEGPEGPGNLWNPKNPQQPSSLQQSAFPFLHPVIRVEGVGANRKRRLREFFVVTAELYHRKTATGLTDAGTPPSNLFAERLHSRAATIALHRAVDRAVTGHLREGCKHDQINLTWVTRMRKTAGWQPVGVPAD